MELGPKPTGTLGETSCSISGDEAMVSTSCSSVEATGGSANGSAITVVVGATTAVVEEVVVVAAAVDGLIRLREVREEREWREVLVCVILGCGEESAHTHERSRR